MLSFGIFFFTYYNIDKIHPYIIIVILSVDCLIFLYVSISVNSLTLGRYLDCFQDFINANVNICYSEHTSSCLLLFLPKYLWVKVWVWNG